MIAFVVFTIEITFESIEEVFVKKEVELFPLDNIWRNELFYMFVFYLTFLDTKLQPYNAHTV